MPEKLDLQSPDLVSQNIEKLAALFPNCVTETADGKQIDFDLLRQELSHKVVEGTKERYRLEWPGKKEAIVTANIPTTKTLRPVREDSVDFDNTENLYIEGDNLEVLKLLQESYLGKIKMIYIDPPYNTGKDFVYKDNFAKDAKEELITSGQKDEYNQRLVVNPETAGRYHSDWLSMMYPRLKLARNLLTADGIVVISIDEKEVHNLRKLCDEIYGEKNFAGEIIWKNSSKNDQDYISIQHEYIVCYVRDKGVNKGAWLEKKEGLDEIYKAFDGFRREHGEDWSAIHQEALEWYKQFPESNPIKASKHYNWMDQKGVYFASDISGPNHGQYVYDLLHPITKEVCKPPASGWRYPQKTMEERVKNNLVHFADDHNTIPNNKTYLSDTEFQSLTSIRFKDGRVASKNLTKLFGENLFTNPKDPDLLYDLMKSFGLGGNDIVLDFFSGSGTTAEALMKLNYETGSNCSYILVQIPEDLNETLKTATGGSKATISRAIQYLLKQNKPTKITELAKQRIRLCSVNYLTNNDTAIGFRVYKQDSSNMHEVYYRPQDYVQTKLELFADNVKPDRTADDLLAQVMLDWGLPLSLKIEQLTIAGKQVFKVAANSLYACFETGIDEAFAREIAKDQPLRIVFRDNGFKDDTAKTNVRQLLKQLSPDTEMKVI
ncbi:site-specific DNA-methyltransferase [Phnomibacter ginsenosidimutans]|uniref:site-specific DNA-methyltransferase (adenine-specific) n=1 Tax=Phnomibacter ginsenosidimutans TaxID=2676868 RepID=A0A6I6GMJ6_9BACT|nr:site-specific DNA-methyltransferase [Phnomibacter ginsenosidimutans]QGW28898.1 site-specific DNA-methyltransferase [Phnomibacter ginsenosidimutans]